MEDPSQSPPTPPVFVKRRDLPPPEPTAPRPMHWQTAPLRRRTLAWAIDVVIVIGFTVLLSAPTSVIYEPAGPFSDRAGWSAEITGRSTTDDLLITALETLIMWAVWTVYLGATAARRGPENGQTLGKLTLGLRVRLADGSPLPRAVAWRRALWIPALLSLPNIATALLDAASGSAPFLSDAADIAEYLVLLGILVLTQRSAACQTPYDERLGTVVVASRPVGGREDAALIRSSAVGEERYPVEPRAATTSTWILLALTAAGLLGLVASVLVG